MDRANCYKLVREGSAVNDRIRQALQALLGHNTWTISRETLLHDVV
jgi:hypothetical protein